MCPDGPGCALGAACRARQHHRGKGRARASGPRRWEMGQGLSPGHGEGAHGFPALLHSYIWQHIEIGYVQGMCDLLAPLLVILDDGEWVALPRSPVL